MGQFDEATAEQGQALALLQDSGSQESVTDAEHRLGLYEKRRPFRDVNR